jgi:hypothetical protein
VKSIFLAYNFTGSDLQSLLKACTSAAEEEMEDLEIKDLIELIGAKPGVDLKGLFYKEP